MTNETPSTPGGSGPAVPPAGPAPAPGSTVTAPPPPSPYDAPPAWNPVPVSDVAPSGAGGPGLRGRLAALGGRMVRLWAALAVGAACLVVGLGLGLLLGHETAGSGSSDLQRPPGLGQRPGLDGQDPGGRGFDGPDTAPDGQRGTQSDGQQSGTSS